MLNRLIISPQHVRSRSWDASHVSRLSGHSSAHVADSWNSTTVSKSQDTEQRTSDRQPKRMEGGGRVPSPNFRHYPGGDAPTRSFATIPAQMTTIVSPQPTSSTSGNDDVNEPDSPCARTATTSLPLTESDPNPSHPFDFTQDTSDAFSGAAANLELYPHVLRPLPPATVNMSDTSIVHLPPRSASCSTGGHGTPAHSDSSWHISEPHLKGHSSSSLSQRVVSPYGSLPSLDGSGVKSAEPEPAVGLEGSLAPLRSSSSSIRSGSSARGTGKSGDSSSEEPLVTFRFEHREDGDGHHVIVGREGKLARCEDEVRMSLDEFCRTH